jgi:hypothetical protein
MPSFSVDTLTAQVDKLLAEYKSLQARSQYDDLSDLEIESNTFIIRLRSAIERLAPTSSTYITEMKAAADDDRHNSTGDKIKIYVGILCALRADADEGWLARVTELVHADTFSDFVEQATELAYKGYKNAAAVVAGSTLEAHIRFLCQKNGLNVQLPSGQAMKADAMNVELVKASVYNNLQQKAVTSWLAIRNAAAHGEYDKYNNDQVINMITSVHDFMLRYPA